VPTFLLHHHHKIRHIYALATALSVFYWVSFAYNLIHPHSRYRHSPRLVIIYMFTLSMSWCHRPWAPTKPHFSRISHITRAVGEVFCIPHPSVAAVRVYLSSCPLFSDAVNSIQAKLGNLYVLGRIHLLGRAQRVLKRPEIPGVVIPSPPAVTRAQLTTASTGAP